MKTSNHEPVLAFSRLHGNNTLSSVSILRFLGSLEYTRAFGPEFRISGSIAHLHLPASAALEDPPRNDVPALHHVGLSAGTFAGMPVASRPVGMISHCQLS